MSISLLTPKRPVAIGRQRVVLTANGAISKNQDVCAKPTTGGLLLATPENPAIWDEFVIYSGLAVSATNAIHLTFGNFKVNGNTPSPGNTSRAKISKPAKRLEFIFLGADIGWIASHSSDCEYVDYNPNSIDLTFVSSDDTNDVFYWLGTNRLTEPYSNPYPSKISSFCDFGVYGRQDTLTDRANPPFVYIETPGWIAVDFGAGYNLQPTYYSLRQGNLESYAYYLRNWKLQGSKNLSSNDAAGANAATWVDLDIQTNNTTVKASNDWVSMPVIGATEGYRWLRVAFTGNNSSGTPAHCLGEWRFYGKLSFPT